MRVVLIALVAALCIGCAAKGISPNDVFAFNSTSEQRQFERRALTGDGEAAQRLTDYYLYFRNDFQKAFYWAKVGAAHGDTISAKNAQTLREIIREQKQ